MGDVRVLRYRDLPETRWRNGAGTTRQIIAVPSGSTDAFLWKLSIASILESGPFSAYPGVDRILLNCGPGALALEVNGVQRRLPRHEQLAFDGEDDVSAALPDGPTHDLNLMTNRSACRGSLERLHLDGPVPDGIMPDRTMPAGTTLPGPVPDGTQRAYVILAGSAVVDGIEVGPLDTVLPSGSAPALLFRDTLVAAVTIAPH